MKLHKHIESIQQKYTHSRGPLYAFWCAATRSRLSLCTLLPSGIAPRSVGCHFLWTKTNGNVLLFKNSKYSYNLRERSFILRSNVLLDITNSAVSEPFRKKNRLKTKRFYMIRFEVKFKWEWNLAWLGLERIQSPNNNWRSIGNIPILQCFASQSTLKKVVSRLRATIALWVSRHTESAAV